MRASLPVSALLHGTLLAWAFLGLSKPQPFKTPDPQPIEVATITEDGLTRLMQGERSAKAVKTAMAPESRPTPVVKEAAKPIPPPPPTAAAPPPPPPPEPVKPEPPPPPQKVEAPPPPPKPEPPAKDEIAELALKAEAEAKAEAERKAAEERKRQEEARKAEEKRKRDDALRKQREEQRRRLAEAKAKADAQKKSDSFFDDMSALVSKERPKAAPPQGGQVANNSTVRAPQAGAPEGRDRQLTGSELGVIGALMNEMVGRCWNPPVGQQGAGAATVDVEFRLSPAGQIVGAPRVVSPVNTPAQAAMADTVMRALMQCQPYTRLPAHLYKGGWDHMISTFDTSRMYR